MNIKPKSPASGRAVRASRGAQALLLATLVMAPLSAHAATQTKIFFVSNRDTTTDIWTADADGANPTKLIPDATDPALSLDGTRLAFVQNSDIYIARVAISGGVVSVTGLDNSATLTALTTDGGATVEASPSFSPSGSQLIFESGPVGNTKLFTINSNDSDDGLPTSAFARSGASSSPRFVSEDQIVFASRGATPLNSSFNSLVSFVLGSATNSFVVEEPGNTSANSITRLTVSPLDAPVGRKVVFSRAGAPTRGLIQDNLNQTSAIAFSSSLPGDDYPSFSPDGTKIIFSSTNTSAARGDGTGGASEIFLLNADNTGLKRLTNNAANDFAPVIGDITVSGAPLPAPTITNFTPASGPIGTSVVITGTNFTGATSVTFNGTAAVAPTVNSDTQITATVPTGATTGTISVVTPNGTATSAAAFTVTETPSLVVTTNIDNSTNTDNLISLREAVAFANTDGVASAITFNVSGTITLTGGALVLVNDSALSILGPESGVTISGNNNSRIFTIFGATATLSNLTLRDGNSTDGGAIQNNLGTLTVTNSTFTGNLASQGGAIFSSTTPFDAGQPAPTILTLLRNCTFTGNSATTVGGAIYNTGGVTRIESCTIAGNSAPINRGAGVASFADNDSPTRIQNSIIADNRVPGGGGADSGTDVNFVFAGTNSVTSLGNNAIGDGNAAPSFTGTGDQRGVTAAIIKLDALADNGGSTPTRALLAGSVAVNKGSNSAAADLTTDQRGPGFPRIVGGTVDIGAFESTFANRPPLLNNATYSTPLGVSFSQQLAGSDPDGDTLTYARSLGALPTGLNLSSSGLISGTPTVAGQFPFSVNVNDGNNTLTARFIIIVSSMADAIGPNVSRPALNASYTRDQLEALVYEGTIADVAAGGATPSGVSRLLFQLRRESDKTSYSGTSDGFTTNLNRGYYAAILSDAVPNTTAGARPFKRTFSTFIPPASVLTVGPYSLVIAAQDVAGNWSIEVVPINIVTAPPVSRFKPATPFGSSALRSSKSASGGKS